MSSTSGGQVFTATDIALPASAVAINDGPFTIFTVPLNEGARIESVYMFADYMNVPSTTDIYILSLVDQSGVILFTQPTPKMVGNDAWCNFAMTWARGGNDTAQLAVATSLATGAVPQIGWSVMALPDLFLKPNSTIQLSTMRGNDGTQPAAVNLDNIVTTYTPGASAGVSTAALDITPYLLPQAP